ncbi:MAG: DUF3568 domain-containing protein [Gemmataceae bacterium]|nr:DUF3568 domain-containing protein [Gemmataceae bacterium]MDW8264765.1 DUF3568 family protein [Gemmataceae bacterium]
MRAQGSSHTTRTVAYIALAGLALGQSGCLLAAAALVGGAAAGVAYAHGKVCRVYEAPFDHAWAASRTAIAELGMPLIAEQRDHKGSGFLETRMADGERVRIYLEEERRKFPADAPWTRICVRVATFGDLPVSERILEQIGAHLVPIRLAPVPGPGWTPATPLTPSPTAAVPSAPTAPVPPAPLPPAAAQPAPPVLPAQTSPPPLAQ